MHSLCQMEIWADLPPELLGCVNWYLFIMVCFKFRWNATILVRMEARYVVVPLLATRTELLRTLSECKATILVYCRVPIDSLDKIACPFQLSSARTYIIYIDGISRSTELGNFILFADDTNIVADDCKKRVNEKANRVLHLVHLYMKCNLLHINIKKCSYIHFKHSRASCGNERLNLKPVQSIIH